jgi:CheY-like chemotaxis protein/anti-sigma regulatory factor (Ser/Thr protein kinase)
MGDAARLIQVLGNVLTNAVKFTHPGGRIRLDARATDQDVELRVIDDGCGIAPELLPHVFDLFVQSARTLDRSQGGLGIGLSVVKRLVEMHGGSVAVASDGMGCGTMVTIRLPRVAAPEAPEAPGRRDPAVSRNILVADDNRDAADSLAMLLSAEGHHVEVVYSARSVLDAAERLRPDFILLDVGLPHMSGYEVAKLLRQTESLQRSRIVAVTGYGREQDRQRGLAAGFDDYLVKPVSVDELARVLATHSVNSE